jgi:hypothetical protein
MLYKLNISFAAICLFCINLHAFLPENKDTLVLKGQYFNENLIVLNPHSGNTFSVSEVIVNSVPVTDELRSSAFEIDLKYLNLQQGDSVRIEIVYIANIGVPQIVNPEALRAGSNFRFVSADCDRKNMLLQWVVECDELTESFEVEHFRWDKWITIGIVNPGDFQTHPSYSGPFVPHSGRNLFRIKYIDADGNMFFSNEIRFTSKDKEIQLLSGKSKDIIEFSSETFYQLFNENGAMVFDGQGTEIDISALEKGRYYLNYDNKTTTITKK